MADLNILVFLEHQQGTLKRPAEEVAARARKLAKESGAKLGAVILGSGASRGLAELAGFGRIFLCEDSVFDALNGEALSGALAAAIADFRPSLMLFSATAIGREIAPLAAHRLQTAVAADVTALEFAGEAIEVQRPIYAGKAIATYRCPFPAVATLRPHAFPAGGTFPAGDTGEPATPAAQVTELPPPEAKTLRSRVVETRPAPGTGRVELTEADIVVSGGRGMRGPEHFALLEELSKTLGAALGASRAVCDSGWRPHSEQVGQTGKTVCPKLYIACGISGAIQHLAGMSSSKCIVAINKDPAAPIFQVADYGIVGDVFEIVPLLNEKVKKYLHEPIPASS